MRTERRSCSPTGPQPLPPRRVIAIVLAHVVLALGMPAVGGALAQTTSLPGIVISTPPAGPVPGAAQSPLSPFARPPEAAPAPPAAPAPKAKSAAAIKPKPKATAASDQAGTGHGGGGQSIIMLVNDDPITALDVHQRAQLNALSADIGARASANMKALVQSEGTQKRFRAMVEQIVKDNQASKTREQIMAMIDGRKTQFALQLQQEAVASARASVLPGAKKGALEELIEERIKLQEAKRLNVNIEDSQIDDIIKGMAEKNKMTPNQFADHLKKMGADVGAMKARFKATLSWNDVVRRRFSSQVTVSQREIDKFAAAGTTGEDEVELQLQRITLRWLARWIRRC